MRLGLRDSRLEPLVSFREQQVDCILGPSRIMMDPIEQWENEGGQVPGSNDDRWREWHRRMQPVAGPRVPLATKSPLMAGAFGATDLRACGRCHGPVSLGRSTLLGRLLSYCVAVEHYQCVDATCGWSGMRMVPGRLDRLLPERRMR